MQHKAAYIWLIKLWEGDIHWLMGMCVTLCVPALVSVCSLEWVCSFCLGLFQGWPSIYFSSLKGTGRGATLAHCPSHRGIYTHPRYNVAVSLFHDVSEGRWYWCTALAIISKHSGRPYSFWERLRKEKSQLTLCSQWAQVLCRGLRVGWAALPTSEMSQGRVITRCYTRWWCRPWISSVSAISWLKGTSSKHWTEHNFSQMTV